MSDKDIEQSNKIIDNYKEHKMHTTPDPQCSSCYIASCKYCHGEKFIEGTEWADGDKSYDITRRCICQED